MPPGRRGWRRSGAFLRAAAWVAVVLPLPGCGGDDGGAGAPRPYRAGFYDFDGDGRPEYVLETPAVAAVLTGTDDTGHALAFHRKDPQRLLAEVDAPLELWAALEGGGSAREAARLASAGVDGLALEGSAELLLAEGTEVQAGVRIEPAGPESFRIRLSAEVRAEGTGAGLRQRLRVTTVPPGEAWEAVDYVLPGWWYRKNTHTTPTAPSEHLSHTWVVREDRIAYPQVILHHPAKAYSLTLTRSAAATRDPAPRAPGRPFEGDVIYLAADGETDVAGLGFSDQGDRQALIADYPFAEEAFSYQSKVLLLGIPDPTGPVYGFLENREGLRLEHAWLLRLGGEATLQEALAEGWRTAHGQFAPEPVAQACTEAEIRASLAAYYRDSFFFSGHEASVAGYYTWLNHDGTPVLKVFDVAFLGMCLLHAKHALDHAAVTGDAELRGRAVQVLDTWCRNGMQNGFLHDGWQVALYPADAIGSPFNFTFPFLGQGYSSTRRHAEALFALLLAERAERARGISHRLWESTIETALERLLSVQLADGGYARTHDIATAAPLDPNIGGTPSAIPTLVEAWRSTGDVRALEAARRAGDFVIRNMIDPLEYYGSTLDATAEDKEAALISFYAMRVLHEADPARKWLQAAVKAAEATLTWQLLVDLPFSGNPVQEQLLARTGLRTAGFGTVSSENNHIDVYAFGLPGSLWWLAERTGREAYREMAVLILRNMLQVVSCPGADNGIGLDGLVPEVIQQTWWDFGFLGKGFYQEMSSQWTVASLWFALDDLRTFTGVPLEAL